MSRWSDLPQCLLELILKPLTLPDRLRFGSVCRTWLIAQTQYLHPPAPPLPFLTLHRSDKSFELFSFSDRRTYKTLPRSLRLSSSLQGWILLQPTDGIVFFNRFIKKYVSIPRINSNVGSFSDWLLFSTPSDPNGIFLVKESEHVFWICHFDNLGYPQIRSRKWEEAVVSNVVFCQGKLFALNKNGSLAIVDAIFPHDITTHNMRLKPEDSPLQKQRRGRPWKPIYVMVESCGELLMVRVEERPFKRFCCSVFRADLTNNEWMKLENLGDRMLFLSAGSSISVSAKETGCKGNRIYYIPQKAKINIIEGWWYAEIELGRNVRTIHSITCDAGTFSACLTQGHF